MTNVEKSYTQEMRPSLNLIYNIRFNNFGCFCELGPVDL